MSVKQEPGGRSTEASKVIFLARLPYLQNEDELIALGQRFGRVTKVLHLAEKNCAFLEFQTVGEAQVLFNHASRSPVRIMGKEIMVTFSKKKYIQTDEAPSVAPQSHRGHQAQNSNFIPAPQTRATLNQEHFGHPERNPEVRRELVPYSNGGMNMGANNRAGGGQMTLAPVGANNRAAYENPPMASQQWGQGMMPSTHAQGPMRAGEPIKVPHLASDRTRVGMMPVYIQPDGTIIPQRELSISTQYPNSLESSHIPF